MRKVIGLALLVTALLLMIPLAVQSHPGPQPVVHCHAYGVEGHGAVYVQVGTLAFGYHGDDTPEALADPDNYLIADPPPSPGHHGTPEEFCGQD